MRVGIMQGRLLPPIEERIQRFPRDRWAEEFAYAKTAGLSAIEWIYEEYGKDSNPLRTDAGIEKIKTLSAESGIEVRSVCADYFMDAPLVRTVESELADRIATLEWLIGRCSRLGATRVILPFVDISRIETKQDTHQVIDVIRNVIDLAEKEEVELHLETSLSPEAFAEFLLEIPDEIVKVNYDSGNSASLGYDPRKEFAAYGGRIGSVHLKDRLCGGGTVALGTGDADFESVFQGLTEIGYNRDLILQVARDTSGDEIRWARQNRLFVETNWPALT